MLSQVELAEAMHVSQPRVSAIKRGDLGGALRVTAVFGDEQVSLLKQQPTLDAEGQAPTPLTNPLPRTAPQEQARRKVSLGPSDRR